MTLREEIQDIIYKTIGGKEHVGIRWTECQEATNEVILKIEKRIDSMIQERLEERKKKPFKERDIQNTHDIIVLENVKKEVLK